MVRFLEERLLGFLINTHVTYHGRVLRVASLLTTTIWVIADTSSQQFHTLSQVRHPLFLPSTFAICFPSCYVCISICSAHCRAAKKAENISLWKESRILSLYVVSYNDNCYKFGISGTCTIPSPLFLGPASLPPSAPISPSISSLAARQELQIPSKAKPLLSPALGWVAQKQLLQHKAWCLCQKAHGKFSLKQHQGPRCVQCVIPVWHLVAWRRRGWVAPLLPRSNLHTDLIPLQVLSTPIR